MAVAQEFIDLFIRITDLDRVYPGGLAAYLERYAEDVGFTIWHDQYLLREGAMSSADIKVRVNSWEKLGLVTCREEGGEPVEWLEVCVSLAIAGQPTLPCSWIAFDDEIGGAYLKGTEPGPLVGPSRRGDFSSACESEVWVSDPTFQRH